MELLLAFGEVADDHKPVHQPSSNLMGPESAFFSDRLLVAVSALLLNALLGGPLKLHRALKLHKPGQWMVRAIRLLERRLNREHRPPDERRKRGTLVTMALLAAGAGAGSALIFAFRYTYYGGLLEIVLVASLISLRQSADLASEVAQALARGESEAAREAFAGTAWRNAAILDGYGLSRAAVETLAARFTDRVMSPLLWYVLLGLPGLFTARMLTLLADATGHVRDFFGRTAHALAAAMHYVPSLLAGLTVCVGAMLLPGCHPVQGLHTWILSLPEAYYRRRDLAVWGATLGAALGGPASVYAQGPWLGGATARLYPRDIQRAMLLLWLAGLLFVLGLASVSA